MWLLNLGPRGSKRRVLKILVFHFPPQMQEAKGNEPGRTTCPGMSWILLLKNPRRRPVAAPPPQPQREGLVFQRLSAPPQALWLQGQAPTPDRRKRFAVSAERSRPQPTARLPLPRFLCLPRDSRFDVDRTQPPVVQFSKRRLLSPTQQARRAEARNRSGDGR